MMPFAADENILHINDVGYTFACCSNEVHKKSSGIYISATQKKLYI